jgi:hypothetical protein
MIVASGGVMCERGGVVLGEEWRVAAIGKAPSAARETAKSHLRLVADSSSQPSSTCQHIASVTAHQQFLPRDVSTAAAKPCSDTRPAGSSK